MKIIECVPNFSEGQNLKVIEALASAIESVPGVYLLHQDSGHSANRSVFTFAGEMEAVFEAAFQAIKAAAAFIDMRQQKGTHPRIGACDVCPFVPLEGITSKELVPHVRKFAERVHQSFGMPIFLYEDSASSPLRRALARHRIGGYEALDKRMREGLCKADFGHAFHANFGGMVMGARPLLLAYNINLKSKSAKIAHEIACELRELGRPTINEKGQRKYIPGKLKKVRAIGWFIPEFEFAQVSINLVDFKTTPIHVVFDTCREIAKKHGIELDGSELIGLIPEQALIDSGRFYMNQEDASEESAVQASIEALGLSRIKAFDPEKRILERVLKSKAYE